MTSLVRLDWLEKFSKGAAENLNVDILILMFFMGGQWNKTILPVNSSQEFWRWQQEADVADHVTDTSEQEKKRRKKRPQQASAAGFCKGMWRTFHARSTLC